MATATRDQAAKESLDKLAKDNAALAKQLADLTKSSGEKSTADQAAIARITGENERLTRELGDTANRLAQSEARVQDLLAQQQQILEKVRKLLGADAKP